MIYDLYVISKESGICSYHKGFGTTLVNSDLVAGLLTAMFSFMKEVRGDDIKVMVSGTSRFVFNESSKSMFVALVDVNHDGNDVSRFLDGVRKLFAERYGEDGSIPTLSEDDPISREINYLMSTPAKPPDGVKVPVTLGRRLTKLVASELSTQRDALTTLFKKVTEEGKHQKIDEELQKKYRREIENLDRQIEEVQK